MGVCEGRAQFRRMGRLGDPSINGDTQAFFFDPGLAADKGRFPRGAGQLLQAFFKALDQKGISLHRFRRAQHWVHHCNLNTGRINNLELAKQYRWYGFVVTAGDTGIAGSRGADKGIYLSSPIGRAV